MNAVGVEVNDLPSTMTASASRDSFSSLDSATEAIVQQCKIPKVQQKFFNVNFSDQQWYICDEKVARGCTDKYRFRSERKITITILYRNLPLTL